MLQNQTQSKEQGIKNKDKAVLRGVTGSWWTLTIREKLFFGDTATGKLSLPQ